MSGKPKTKPSRISSSMGGDHHPQNGRLMIGSTTGTSFETRGLVPSKLDCLYIPKATWLAFHDKHQENTIWFHHAWLAGKSPIYR